jgi:hypothetical protein
LLIGVFVIPDQIRKEIAFFSAKRLPPRRRYVERPGGPEFIDGNQASATFFLTEIVKFIVKFPEPGFHVER